MTGPSSAHCPHCGADISPAASACGFCGKSIGLSWLLRPVLAGLLIGCSAGLLVGGALWWRAAVRQAASQEAAAATPAASPAPPVDPFYDDLLDKAEADEARGDFRMSVSLLLQAMNLRPERPAARERLERLRSKLLLEHRELAPSQPAAAAPSAPPPEAGPATAQSRDLVTISAGPFLMGADMPDRSPDEYPAHEVILPAFGIEPHEVTVESYRRFCSETRRPFPRQPFGSTPRHPVVSVTWHDARAYCRRLGRRLPTEAEWEKAARCGNPQPWPQPYAWFMEDSEGRCHPVKEKGPSGCDLYDLYGNVWEWTADWYSATYYDRSPKDSPRGPRAGEERVLRGGAFDSPREALPPSFRDKFSPDTGAENRGFRCAK
ncbi:MAG: SUMF1/EgtB/PvdO family nonheme iron enzyme [Elusimicrobia bacterium]|nr:SUMF1/EgtB/PvdO family nonheme iron enzyme [Elusimicrobiota bacterium]